MFWRLIIHRLLRACKSSRCPRPLLLGLLLTPICAQSADIQLRDLEDLDFGSVPPTAGNLSAETRFCVPMQPRGRYSLVATGDGQAGQFTLFEAGNSAHSIDYSVLISDRNRRSGRRVRPGVPLNNLRASRFNRNGRCNPRARLQVSVRGGQLESAAPGRYEGTLSLTVVPE